MAKKTVSNFRSYSFTFITLVRIFFSLASIPRRCLMALIALTSAYLLIDHFGQINAISHETNLSYLSYLEPWNGHSPYWITGKSRNYSMTKKNGLWAIENNSCPLTNGLDSTEENNSPSYNSPRKSGIVVWARRLVVVQKVS